MAALLSYVDENPRNILALKELADLHVKSFSPESQDWSKAIAYYDRIIALGPPIAGSPELIRTYIYALSNKGACHAALGDVAEALYWLSEAQRRARRDSPEWILLTIQLGNTYHYLEMYRDAVRVYRLLDDYPAALSGELDLALMESQPEDPFVLPVQDLSGVVAGANFPDPVPSLTEWIAHTKVYLSIIHPFMSWLSQEERASDETFGLCSADDMSAFADKCLATAATLEGLPCLGVPDYLRSYAELSVAICDRERAILRLTAENLKSVAKHLLDSANPSLEEVDLRAVVREGVLGDETVSLAAERGSLMADLDRIHEETVLAVGKAQKHTWRAAIR
jgi:tetratricopeptide (TPR) repeat protein